MFALLRTFLQNIWFNFRSHFLISKTCAMKKILFATLLFVAVSSSAHEFIVPSPLALKDVKHISDSKVPAPVLENFESMYPNASNVRWSILTGAYQQNTQYMAEFRLDGAKRTARYKPDGTYLGGS